MPQLAFDRTSRTIDVDGRMHVAQCRISKANVCPYWGSEIPDHAALGLDPNKIYNLYRDPVELAAGASTFVNLPLLIHHVPTTAAQPKKEFWVGTLGSTVEFDGTYLVTDLLSVWTAEAIKLIDSHAQEQLSSSYRYTADMSPGVTPDGVPYDGVMRNIVGNHVAIVERGRAGPDVIVADQSLLEKPVMAFKNAKLMAALRAVLPSTVTEPQLIAIDEACSEEMKAKDKAWDGWSDEDKKKAVDEWKSKNGVAADAELDEEQSKKAWDWAGTAFRDPAGNDSRPRNLPAPAPARTDPAVRPLTQADLDRAVQLAQDGTAQRMTKLFEARDKVRPFVGDVVAADSADAVYAFALPKMGVAIDGVHPSAYPALFDMAAKNRQQAAARPVPRAYDAAAATQVRAAIPVLGNINVAH